MNHATAICLVFWCAVATACTDKSPDANTPTDTTTSVSDTSQPSTSSGEASPSTVAAAAAPIDPSARAACADAAALWRTVPGANVTQRDTIVRPGDAVGDSVISGWDQGPPRVACLVVGQLAQGADSLARDRLSWLAPDGQRGRNGWGNVWRLAADGADGFVQTYQRGRTRCQLRTQWDPGDDGDSTYVPDPYYLEEIACWRHGRDLVPIDTAHESLR